MDFTDFTDGDLAIRRADLRSARDDDSRNHESNGSNVAWIFRRRLERGCGVLPGS
jgi:hypothetical protein